MPVRLTLSCSQCQTLSTEGLSSRRLTLELQSKVDGGKASCTMEGLFAFKELYNDGTLWCRILRSYLSPIFSLQHLLLFCFALLHPHIFNGPYPITPFMITTTHDRTLILASFICACASRLPVFPFSVIVLKYRL